MNPLFRLPAGSRVVAAGLTLTAWALVAAPWTAGAVEPLHRIREHHARMGGPTAWDVALPSAQPGDLSAQAGDWMQVLTRWLRLRRGPVAWDGTQSLQLGPGPGGPVETQQARQPSPSTLGSGDTLTVRFESGSCFSHVAGELTYDGQHGQWRLADGLHTASVAPDGSTGLRMCAPLALDASALPRLERLLQYWRSGGGSGCAQELTATVQWRHDGRLVATEQFRDSGCAVPADGLDLVGLWMSACR